MTNPVEVAIQITSSGEDKFDELGRRVLRMRTTTEQAARELANQRYFDSLYAGFAQQEKAMQGTQGVLDETGMYYSRFRRLAINSIGDVVGTLGQMNPALAGVSNALSNVMSGFAFGGGVGAGFALVSTGLSALVQGATSASPAIAALDDEVSKLAQRTDTIDTLMRITGATREHAQAMLEAARNSPEYAAQLDQITSKARENSTAIGMLRNSFGLLVQGTEVEQFATRTIGAFDRIEQGLKDKFGEGGLGGWSKLLIGGAGVEAAALKGDLDQLLGGGGFNYSEHQQRVSAAWQATLGFSQATDESTGALNRNAAAVNQHKSITDKLPGALSAARSELEAYRETITGLGEAHAKTTAQFSKEALKIDVRFDEQIGSLMERLGKQRAKIDIDIGKQRATIEEQLLDSIGELEDRQLKQRTDAYRTYQKSVVDVQKEIEDRARESAQRQAEIQRQLQVTLQNLDRDFGMRIDDAKTEREAARLERDLAIQRGDANQKAQEQSSQVAQQLNEFMRASEERRNAIDEEYRYAAQLRSQEQADAIGKLQERAQKQRDDLNERRAEQLAALTEQETEQTQALNARREQERTALNERIQEESAAYAESLAKSEATHTKRMKQITDLRTEQEKMTENMRVVGESGWGGWITGADQYKQKLIEILELQDYLGRIAQGKEKVAYATNLTAEDIIAMMRNGQWQ